LIEQNFNEFIYAGHFVYAGFNLLKKSYLVICFS